MLPEKYLKSIKFISDKFVQLELSDNSIIEGVYSITNIEEIYSITNIDNFIIQIVPEPNTEIIIILQELKDKIIFTYSLKKDRDNYFVYTGILEKDSE